MVRHLLLWGVVFSLFRAPAAELAPPSTYEGKRITAIRFDPPVQPLVETDIKRLLPLQPGQVLHLAEVRNAIKKLYTSGEYTDIEIDTESVSDGVGLIVRTAEQWFVGPVEVHGKTNSPPNRGQLANATRLQLGQPFDDSQLDTATNGVKRLLERNGLYLAKIDPKVERDTEHQAVSLTFQVEAGKRARFTTPVVTGDTKIGADTVANAAKYKGWFRWKPATAENSQQGLAKVRKKYDKADRLTGDVRMEQREYLPAENRVRPHLSANGGPRIKFHTTGAKVSKGDLQKYVPVFDEETVNRDLLVSGARNLRDYFQDRGYFDVQVDFQMKDTSPDLQEITYVVALGERHKLVHVALQGNRYFKTSDLREMMFLQPAGFIRLRHGRYSQSFASRDEDTIEALYQSNGYRDVKVTTKVVSDYKGKKGDVAVTLVIDEGPQYHVSKIDVDGITVPQKDQLVGRLASVPGQPFSENNVALDRDYILEYYQSSGYPNADFTWQMTPGPGPHEVSVRYKVTEGRRQFVRDVIIYGLNSTRRSLVSPAMTLEPGSPLSWTEMGNMQRNLYNLGVFDKVDMAIQNNDGDTEQKYVLYHFTEGHRYNMAIGVGAEIARIGGSQNSLDNPAGATGFAPRFDLELSRLNLWGIGHSVNFKGRYSTLDRRLSLNYLAPRFRNVDGRNLSVTALYDNTRDVLTFTARRLEGSLQLSQRISKSTTALFRYSWSHDQVDESTLKINPLLIPLFSQPSHIGALSANWVQDRRDDPVDAHRGIYNSADLSWAATYLGGNKNFLRFLGRSSYYKTLAKQYVLASNTSFGIIQPYNKTAGVSGSDYIPLPERFFGGGSTSMRGFPDQQAGQRDLVTGFPIGGNALLFHQTELRFPLIGDNINGVLFEDMGNIYSDLHSISFRVHQNGLTDFNYMVHAAGFGIRYKTPLGPVRLDLAYSINPPAFHGLKGSYQDLINNTAQPADQRVSHFQFFFSIGQAF